MSIHVRRNRVFGAALAVALAAPLAACGSGGSDADSKTVEVWASVDQPVLDGLKAQLDPEAKKAGITIKWSRVDNINQLIMTKLQANDAPDIALIPQPGVVADIVKRGKAIPLDDVVDTATLEKEMVPGTLESGTVDGKLYGLLASMNVKSLVYYPKKAWDKAGYQAPQSLDELNALTEKIKSDGGTPWCIGIGSGAATGWPVTDWFEDLILRYGGADTYDQWVEGKVKFDSPVVREAAAEFEKLAFTDGNTPGGRKSIASTQFSDADDPMWSDDPGCWLMKQGNFITSFFPEDIQADLDANVGVFGFPPASADGEKPVLGGGDLATLLTDNDSSKEVIKLMAQKNLGDKAVANSSYISPFTTFDVSLYPNALQKTAAEVAYDATVFRFDGSDQMPGAVGAGTFWKDMTSWVSGQKSLDDALKDIDASWPSS